MNKLHHDGGTAIVLRQIIDLDNMFRAKMGASVGFSSKPFANDRVVREVLVQDLEEDAPVERFLVGPVNVRRSAFADFFFDSKL